jgi:hypothetical protein
LVIERTKSRKTCFDLIERERNVNKMKKEMHFDCLTVKNINFFIEYKRNQEQAFKQANEEINESVVKSQFQRVI